MSPGQEAEPLAAEGFERLLESILPRFGIELPNDARTKLALYLSELDRWRRRINLTGDLSATDLVRLTVESVFGEQLIAHGERVVDIGSGSGLPGLPIAIVRPDLGLTLVEPRKKRGAFLRHIIRSLSLPNAKVVETRIEEVGGQTFGAATTRALGGFREWLGDAPYIRPGGLLVAWTTSSARPTEEVGASFRYESSLTIPGSEQSEVAVFRKL